MLRTPNAFASFPWLKPHRVRQFLNSRFVMDIYIYHQYIAVKKEKG